MSLVFHRIENGTVFTRDFSPLVQNKEIQFSSTGIAVVYGPNGTGKTSLIKVLNGDRGTRVSFSYNEHGYESGEGVFHVIHDQNNRNIIAGETRDFFLGDNIRREFELQDQLKADRDSLIGEVISSLKNTFGISAGNNPLVTLIDHEQLIGFIKDCLNNKSKGSKYSAEAIEGLLSTLTALDVEAYTAEKYQFLLKQYGTKQPLLGMIDQLVQADIIPNIHVHEIEENDEAISILNRFHKSTCIVCDTRDIDWERLLAAKQANRQTVMEALNEKLRSLIEQVIKLVPSDDPFRIKERLIHVVTTGDIASLVQIQSELNEYKNVFRKLLINEMVRVWNESNLPTHLCSYREIIAERPDVSEEDYLYIQEIISSSMNKPLTVERDANNLLRIRLNNQEFLGKSRDELPLSTGEQNFLSLTFEFLKAKNSTAPIVVIDDPVSSFDSIYKNKVVYAIVKMLQGKKRIVLTHNTDLIRLLNGQHKRCFKLYLLNNTEGELNGFIPLNNAEQEMLISLEKLLQAFRETISAHVRDPELFLISMIPFMRGYANITNNRDWFDQLTQVMHGYKNESVDIARAYTSLFGDQGDKLPDTYTISVPDILSKTVDGVELVDRSRFPLLDKTLRHSFTYLFLRLIVEKKLVERFGIDTTHNSQLGQIISAAYPDQHDIVQIRNRIRLTSKKTLINEFNHFEGNLSIFQPAIDITDQALGKERTDIITFVSTL